MMILTALSVWKSWILPTETSGLVLVDIRCAGLLKYLTVKSNEKLTISWIISNFRFADSAGTISRKT